VYIRNLVLLPAMRALRMTETNREIVRPYLETIRKKEDAMSKANVVAAVAAGMFSLLTSGNALAGTVAILEPTVVGGMSSKEALVAMSQGHTVTIISAATWATMTQAQFSAYDALILGDPQCVTGESTVAAAAANPAWAQAADGNVLLIGTDPVYHYHDEGAQTLVQNGIAFALADAGTGKTGAFVTLSCYYHFSPANTYASFLSGFGDFYVVGGGTTGALNDARIVASHPSLSGLTDDLLSNWYNSVHESFGILAASWPSDFEVLAVAASAGGNFVAPDGTRGYPYILARGVIPDRCGDGDLVAPEECDDGNNNDGDGCDRACNVERTCTDSDGDTVCDSVDACVGDDASGDTDGDDQCDNIDQCPLDASNDADGDGFCANTDNCPSVSNASQTDTDGDGQGDACDSDDDGDGVGDSTDNCQYDVNPTQTDSDSDGAGNACDADLDGDGVIDADDACLPTPNGQIVNASGCSVAQLCPCDNGWKNHGAFVKCNAHATNAFVAAGLMTEAQKGEWMSYVGSSSCGHK